MRPYAVVAALAVTSALAAAQTESGAVTMPLTPAPTAAPAMIAPAPAASVAPAPSDAAPNAPATASVPPPALATDHAVLELRALDKITGRATTILAPLNTPVHFATLTIVARSCYSTPPSETPETSAFLQVDDHRPDQKERRVFSGWMYASSPGLNSMQHPLYDVWAIRCITNAPGQQPSVVAAAPVKPVSPNAGANEAMPTLPEDAGQ
jgi:hypothetical protein